MTRPSASSCESSVSLSRAVEDEVSRLRSESYRARRDAVLAALGMVRHRLREMSGGLVIIPDDELHPIAQTVVGEAIPRANFTASVCKAVKKYRANKGQNGESSDAE